MVSKESVREQLKRIGINHHRGWGGTELKELPNIILPHEEIFECVNGFYEGGFALLVATDVRVLLVDKKPLSYLTVEDLRFDMINEIDYSHRLLGANIKIATGNKTLVFTTVNKPRLRKLISHIQHCMAESKRKLSSTAEGQHQHLEEINQQLRAYLMAQYEQQQKLYAQLQEAKATQRVKVEPIEPPPLEPVKPNPELSDYLFAQSLLEQYNAQKKSEAAQEAETTLPPSVSIASEPQVSMSELYKEGMAEVFGQNGKTSKEEHSPAIAALHSALEINPLKVAYSKLPEVLKNRRFGRPAMNTPSQELPAPEA